MSQQLTTLFIFHLTPFSHPYIYKGGYFVVLALLLFSFLYMKKSGFFWYETIYNYDSIIVKNK